MIKLNPRLTACAGLVRGDVVVDVGTDHGYLPCFLVSEGICSHAYACDIAEGPLSSANSHILQSGLEGKIDAVLSDGLLQLGDEAAASATDIVIAGMGGELIAEIIGRGMSAGKLSKTARLILQPNTKAAVLRRFLRENGYETLSETAVRDGRFIYTVICAEFSGVSGTLDELSATVGKLDPKDPTAREYLEREESKLRSAAKGMAESSAETAQKQAEELISLADGIKEHIETEASK